jgi:hypothetical protein
MADADLKKPEVFELTDNAYKELPGKSDFQLTTGCSVSINHTGVFEDVWLVNLFSAVKSAVTYLLFKF